MEDGGEHWLSFEAGACMRCCASAARNSCRVPSDYGWKMVGLCVGWESHFDSAERHKSYR